MLIDVAAMIADGSVNANGRRYARECWTSEKIQDRVKDGKLLVYFANEDISDFRSNLSSLVGIVKDFTVQDDPKHEYTVSITMNIIDTFQGRILQQLITEGIPISFTAVGIGTPKRTADGIELIDGNGYELQHIMAVKGLNAFSR